MEARSPDGRQVLRSHAPPAAALPGPILFVGYCTILRVLITQVSRDGSERTWRRPVETRVALVICMAALPTLPALLLGLLAASPGPNGGWIALALSVAAAWGLLAWRVLVQSVTLTRDTLVIRNILTTARVPLADVTDVGFRRGAMKVTSGHGGVPGKRFTVGVAVLGSAYWSGLRGQPDALAEAISSAAGLPPPPPRREIISRGWAWVILVAAAACFVFGVYLGPMRSMDEHPSLALSEAGGMLYGLGIATLGSAFRVIRDHRRKRARQAAAGDWNRDAA